MRIAVAILLLASPALQDPANLSVGDTSSSKWHVSGPADVDDGVEVNVRARRVVRMWDFPRKLFSEGLSDSTIRACIEAEKKRFSGDLKAGVAGRYGVTVSTEEQQLFTESAALGSFEPLFTRTPKEIEELLEVMEKAGGFLDEVEKILARQVDNSEKHRDDYLKRVTSWAVKADQVLERCDLTGSATTLRDIYFHIRNVQVWDEGKLPPPGANDPPRNKKKIFMDMELTIDILRKKLAQVPDIISSEVKVSTTLVLERLLAQAGEVERKREAVRTAARAAAKLAEAVPLPDKDLIRLLDQTADASNDPKDLRDALLQAGKSLVIPR
jgi:hypothetical protein